ENNSTITGSDAEITTGKTIPVAAQRLTGHSLGQCGRRPMIAVSINCSEWLEGTEALAGGRDHRIIDRLDYTDQPLRLIGVGTGLHR
ncbi:hypothetical protein, partial [Nocardia sp. NPDC058705]|uniref:hypothetical protein n=1 Tax=Nocardia sp. NPDC058705 TaxID=3346609 RepID=UPI0036A9F1D2